MRRTLEVSAVIAATILIAMGFHAWLTAHDEQLRMQATIATQKQQLDAADARERHNSGSDSRANTETETRHTNAGRNPQAAAAIFESAGAHHAEPVVDRRRFSGRSRIADGRAGKNKKGNRPARVRQELVCTPSDLGE
jgi:hypothetical protein